MSGAIGAAICRLCGVPSGHQRSGGGGGGNGELSYEEVRIGPWVLLQPVKAGDLTWTVTGVQQATELKRRTHETDPDASLYVPSRLDLFLQQVNPGVTQQARVIFNIAPDARGLILRAGDGDPVTDTNGCLNLGI